MRCFGEKYRTLADFLDESDDRGNAFLYHLLELIRNQEIDHKYLQYSLDAIRVIDEVRRQNGIKFPGE